MTNNKPWHFYGERLLSGSCAKWLRSGDGIGNGRHGKKKVDDFDKNERSSFGHDYDHLSNNNYIIFAVGFLTVTHMNVNIAMKNIPVAAKR